MTNLAHSLAAALAQAPLESGVRRSMSLLERVHSGGVIGYVIILLSFVAVALIVVHLVRIREQALAPHAIVDELDRMLRKGDVDGALAACRLPDNQCFLTSVLGAGLSRYRRSPFGALELKGALEEAGQEQIARLYRSTDALALIAGVAPMLGLLGTVVGLTGAFSTIAGTEGFARPDQLAGDISLALVTTILGLTLAIPLTAVVTYFRNRIDSLAGAVASIVDELAAHVEQPAQPAPPPAPQSRPVPTQAASPAPVRSAGQ